MRYWRVRAVIGALIVLCISTIGVIGLWPWQAPSEASGLLRVTFIDVGQGDAAWLNTPDGLDILIDGGEDTEDSELFSYLQAHGVTDIEALILSHGHTDHVGGLVTILEEDMDVDQAFHNCDPNPDAPPIYQTFQDLLTDEGIPTTCVRDGDTIPSGAYVSAVAVHPPEPLMPGTVSKALNNNSIVLRLTYGSIDFLFTGDVQSEGENVICGGGSTIEAEVLKVAHHGSDYSSTEAFLTKVDPEIAIISVGANSYGHPGEEALQRLADAGASIYRTDQCGTIVVTTDGTTYSVECESYVYLPIVMRSYSGPVPVYIETLRDDTSDEYVQITNRGTTAQDMTGWQIHSVVGDQWYTFPSGYILAAGTSVRVHSGPDAFENPPTDLLWGHAYIWRNEGDEAILYDDASNLVDSYSY